MDDSQLLNLFNKTSFNNLMTLADVNQRFKELILNHTAISKYRITEKNIIISTKRDNNGIPPKEILMNNIY